MASATSGKDGTVPDRATRATHRSGGERVRGGASASGPAASEAVDQRAAAPDLALEETLLVVLRGVGAAMFLTSKRLIVARDGVERRPRSGIVSYPLDTIRHLRLELGNAPSGRIAVWTDSAQEAVSMFFDARSLEQAHELIDIARPHIARQRRRGPGARPVRPPDRTGRSGSRDTA